MVFIEQPSAPRTGRLYNSHSSFSDIIHAAIRSKCSSLADCFFVGFCHGLDSGNGKRGNWVNEDNSDFASTDGLV